MALRLWHTAEQCRGGVLWEHLNRHMDTIRRGRLRHMTSSTQGQKKKREPSGPVRRRRLPSLRPSLARAPDDAHACPIAARQQAVARWESQTRRGVLMCPTLGVCIE